LIIYEEKGMSIIPFLMELNTCRHKVSAE